MNPRLSSRVTSTAPASVPSTFGFWASSSALSRCRCGSISPGITASPAQSRVSRAFLVSRPDRHDPPVVDGDVDRRVTAGHPRVPQQQVRHPHAPRLVRRRDRRRRAGVPSRCWDDAGMSGPQPVTVDGAALSADDVEKATETLVATLADADEAGWYGALEVERPWSSHNPRLDGEFARAGAIHRYLCRELASLLVLGARITARASRPQPPFDDPAFFAALDEDRVDIRAKKLFLFSPGAHGALGRPDRALHRHPGRGLPAPRALHQLRDARRGVPRALPRRRPAGARARRCPPTTTAPRPATA